MLDIVRKAEGVDPRSLWISLQTKDQFYQTASTMTGGGIGTHTIHTLYTHIYIYSPPLTHYTHTIHTLSPTSGDSTVETLVSEATEDIRYYMEKSGALAI